MTTEQIGKVVADVRARYASEQHELDANVWSNADTGERRHRLQVLGYQVSAVSAAYDTVANQENLIAPTVARERSHGLADAEAMAEERTLAPIATAAKLADHQRAIFLHARGISMDAYAAGLARLEMLAAMRRAYWAGIGAHDASMTANCPVEATAALYRHGCTPLPGRADLMGPGLEVMRDRIRAWREQRAELVARVQAIARETAATAA